ncbi:MAG: ABC transporter ATP-binding protein [Solirubrobacteraceae bacterium]|jgi:peptide/nickel transport system ATP-binding protein
MPELNGASSIAPTREQQPVLEVRDLSIVYDGDVKAVDHVDLTLGRGETVGLAGESGCGKSTLALGLCRLLRPPAVITSGNVIYRGSRLPPEGVDLMSQSSKELRKLRWREISVVFQSAMNALNPVLRVRDQLGDALDAHLHPSRKEKQERLGELLDLVGIPRERLRSYPHELSGGMRQRVMIAMALAAEPEVVIMDEPTTALDVVVQKEILAQIVELQSKLNFAVLFITHDLSLLLEIADRIAVMYAGKVVEFGTADRIHNQPSHPYTQGLLGSFPSVHGARRELAGIPGSPPDLRALPPGCPFVPRCTHATDKCREVDMSLLPVVDHDQGHLTACPFVRPASADDGAREAPPAKAKASRAARRPA